jgi:hypothetical protein
MSDPTLRRATSPFDLAVYLADEEQLAVRTPAGRLVVRQNP